MSALHIAVAGAVGLPVGSLLNRLILREPGYVIRDPKDLPDDADPSLLHELEPEPDVVDVPVLGVLRPTTVHPRWLMATEIVTAAAYAFTVHRFGRGVTALAVLVLITALVTLAATDVRVYRIPDRLNGPATAGGLAAVVAASLYHGVPEAIVGALVGGVAYFGFLFLAHLISPRGMGFGDVKLAFLMGLYLGWLGWEDGAMSVQVASSVQLVLLGAALGSVVGAVLGLGYAAIRRSTKAAFPYGPSLAIGCAVVAWFALDLR